MFDKYINLKERFLPQFVDWMLLMVVDRVIATFKFVDVERAEASSTKSFSSVADGWEEDIE
jgi:hypothetical protein